MKNDLDYNQAILNSWKTNTRITIYFIEHITLKLWSTELPDSSKRTIGMISSHIHNTRCMWIKMIGKNIQSLKVSIRVDPRHANRKIVIGALAQSSQSMLKLLEACINNGGKLPTKPAWLNFPDDIIHFLTYFVAHEGHHRGQIILLARQLKHRFPSEVTNGVAMEKTIKRSRAKIKFEQ